MRRRWKELFWGFINILHIKPSDREELKEMGELNIIADAKDYSLIDSAVKKARIIADAVYFARDLVSAPSNEMTPSIMAQKAREIAKQKKCILQSSG